MDKNKLKFFKLVCLIILLGSFSLVRAINDFTLEMISDCHIQYMGDACVVEMKVTNNTGEDLDGKAFFKVEYGGVSFDGEGIYASFLPGDGSGSWRGSSDWQNGEVFFTGFDILKGEAPIFLKIKTHSALMPGQYAFSFALDGASKEKEQYSAVVPVGGGGILGMFGTSPSSDTGSEDVGEDTAEDFSQQSDEEIVLADSSRGEARGLISTGNTILQNFLDGIGRETASEDMAVDEIADEQEELSDEEKELPKGLLAALGSLGGKISGPFLWGGLMFLCLLILAGAGLKKWKQN